MLVAERRVRFSGDRAMSEPVKLTVSPYYVQTAFSLPFHHLRFLKRVGYIICFFVFLLLGPD